MQRFFVALMFAVYAAAQTPMYMEFSKYSTIHSLNISLVCQSIVGLTSTWCEEHPPTANVMFTRIHSVVQDVPLGFSPIPSAATVTDWLLDGAGMHPGAAVVYVTTEQTYVFSTLYIVLLYVFVIVVAAIVRNSMNSVLRG